MKKYFLLISFFLAGFLYPQTVSVKSQTLNSFRVVVKDNPAKFSDEVKGNYTIRDFYEFSDPKLTGTYKLPYQNIVLAIPPNSKPAFEIISKSESKIKNVLPKLNPAVELMRDSSLKITDVPFSLRKEIQREILEVEGYFWYRDNYCVNLKVNTHFFDEQSSNLIVYDNIEIEVKMPPGFYIPASTGKNINTGAEDLEGKSFIANFDMAKSLKGTPKFIESDSTDSWINYTAKYLKLGVANNSIYRINKADLVNYGINTSTIDPRKFQLFNKGKEVAIRVTGEDDGSFDDSDFVEFWGTKNYNTISHRVINAPDQEYNEYLNRYDDTSYFFLTWEQQPGKRMRTSINNSTVNDTLNYYYDTQHFEQNNNSQNLNNDELANQTPDWLRNKSWYWQFLYVQSLDYNFTLSDVYPNKSANIYFKAVSSGSDISSNSHNLALRFNNSKVDSQVVNRFQQVLLNGAVQSNNIINGSNTITIQNYANASTVNSLSIDWYEIEYPRYIKAINDSLYFHVRDNLNNSVRVIKLDNITSQNILLYKVKPEVKFISGYQLNNNKLIYKDTLSDEDEYYAIAAAKILKPRFIQYRSFTNLRNSTHSAEYLAITHPNFSSSVSQYISTISQNYNVTSTAVYVNDIYDEFSYGYPYPESIKLFLQATLQYWQEPKPKFVALIGDGNYDYKGYIFRRLGVKVGSNFVPSYGFPVSDNWYAIYNTSFPVPQFFMGRIPVNSNDELLYYRQKVIDYNSVPFDEWNKRYILFSSGIDPGEFPTLKAPNDSVINNILNPPPISGNYTHFYKTATPQSDFGPYTPEQVKNAINLGALFISYLGHSGTATWDNGINNVIQLRNVVDREPLITDFGCSTAKFCEPDIICFGERFLLDVSGQAIGYIGNSSLGFLTTATTAPRIYFKYITRDSLHQVGVSHVNSKAELLTNYGVSSVNSIFSYTNTLLGDPIIELRIPNKPNLKIVSTDVVIKTQVSDILDSIPVYVNLRNLGKAENDSLTISISHFTGSTLFEAKNYQIKLPERNDTLIVWLKVKNKAGENSLNIKVDSNNEVDEIYEDDNNVSFPFTVYSSTLRDLLANTIENSSVQKLRLLNPAAYKEPVFPITYQISSGKEFTSFSEFSVSSDTFLTSINLSGLAPSQRYWYRYKIGDSGNEFSTPKSFYNSDSSEFLLIDSASFNNQSQNNVSYKNNSLSLSNDSVTYSVLSAGFRSGSTCVIARNGVNLLSNSFFAGLGIVVLNQYTLEPDTSAWYNLFNNSPNVQALTDFINSIENGKIVLMGVSSDAANNLTPALKSAIRSLGSTKFDTLQFQASWALIGKKGTNPGNVIEDIRDPFSGSIFIDSVFSVLATEGGMLTSAIGPAAAWQTTRISQKLSPGSGLKYKLLGITKTGEQDTLNYVFPEDSIADLRSVDAKQYPYLKVLSEFKAGDNNVSPQINSLAVNYVSAPELGLNYQVVSVSRDTIIQGDGINLNFKLFNVGESSADSFKIKIARVKPDNTVKTLTDSLIKTLAPNSKINYSVNYKSVASDGTGRFLFRILVDENNKITELYKDNNVFEIPFYIKPDTTITSVTSSTLEAEFDGKEITDGDYVSPTPNIVMTLHYPIWFPVSDTTAVEFYFDQEKLNYSQLNIDNDSANKRIIYKYQPQLPNGEHVVRIFGKNVNGEMETTPGYQKTFLVSDQVQLLNVYNYPNPFTKNTYFTFRLTQVPDELKVKIYTVAGRLIKEIAKTSAELNFDFNTIPWDGRDEDGDEIANGVYFYKIIIKKGTVTSNITDKLARIR